MTSAIGGVGGGSWAMQRPDTASMVKNLFAKVDTKNQGYIDKEELQSAFDQIATDAASGGGSANNTSGSVDAIFKKLDGDSDGKITEQEMTTGMQKLADQFDSQFNQSRTSGMGSARQGDEDGGFTKDQLTSMAKEIGSSDSKRSELMSKIADNFDAADTDSDGKVNREEAMAFDKASKTDATSSDASTAVEGSSAVKHAHGAPPPPPPSAASDSGSSSDSSADSASKVFAAADTNQDGKVSIQELLASLQADSSSSGSSTGKTDDSTASVMKMVMQLMQAYGGFGQDAAQSGSGISVAA